MNTALGLHRIYFFAVLCFALWIGCIGFFWPQQILLALPWSVPPLHARFIGALYLSGSAFLLLSLFARTLSQIRMVVYIAFIWTGWLLVVTIIHWSAFDLARSPVWFWLFAYIVFPVSAAWLIYRTPAPAISAGKRIQTVWITLFYAVQGLVFTLLAALCFIKPTLAIEIWPWKISSFLAQVYSGPLLAYGFFGLMIAIRRNWVEARLPTIGLLIFAVLTLIGSARHSNLFTWGSLSAISWFAGLALLALVTAIITVRGMRHA